MKKTNKETGLSQVQEQSVLLMLAGKSISDTARELKIHRSTIHEWRKQIPYKAYYNKVCNEIKDDITVSIWGLYKDGLDAIRNCLQSKNDTIRFRTACWLLEQLQDWRVGESNPKEIIRQQCIYTESLIPDLQVTREVFDEKKFKDICHENNLLEEGS